MADRIDDVTAPKHTAWYRFVHRTIVFFGMPFARKKFNIKAERSKIRPSDPSFIVFNHGCHVDFIATNHILPVYSRAIVTDAVIRKRLPRLILPLLTDFIYRRKGQKADAVVESAKLTIENGVNVFLSPEGNVTQNGTSETVRQRTGELIKSSNAGLVTIRLEGNYMRSPFWAKDSDSKGPIYGRVVGIYSKDEISSMTPEEINSLISRDIYINQYEWNRFERHEYDRHDRAEYMERVVFMCPRCKTICSLHSSHDTLSCDSCGYSVDVDEYGFFQGEDAVFDNLYEWDQWQKKELLAQRDDWVLTGRTIADFDHIKVQFMDGSDPVLIYSDSTVSISANELRIAEGDKEMIIPLSEIISFTSLFADTTGMNHNGRIYQFRSAAPMSNRLLRIILGILRGKDIS